MKYLIFALIVHFVTLSTAQSNELAQIDKLIHAFKSEQKITDLEEAHERLIALFAEDSYRPDSKALAVRAQLLTQLLLKVDQEKPLEFEQEVHHSYSTALEKETRMSYRQSLLTDLYLAKIKMTELGNKAYEDENYDAAHQHYKNALGMNELEIAYPKFATIDTSLLFTSAVFAKLAEKNKVAIDALEELAELAYNRKEIYDYLIELYGKMEGKEKDIERIQALKDQRFPE